MVKPWPPTTKISPKAPQTHRLPFNAINEEEMEEGRKKLMVAIDDNDESYHSLLWVLDNLQETLISHRLLLFAAEPPPLYAGVLVAGISSARLYTTVSPASEFISSSQEIEKKVAIGILEKAKTICRSRGVNAETILEEGDAKVEICKAVEKHNISILVLAEQRLGLLKGAFSWSVSDYCVQYAKCPVLVVKN